MFPVRTFSIPFVPCSCSATFTLVPTFLFVQCNFHQILRFHNSWTITTFTKPHFKFQNAFFRFKALKDAFENCSCLGPQRKPISTLSVSCPSTNQTPTLPCPRFSQLPCWACCAQLSGPKDYQLQCSGTGRCNKCLSRACGSTAAPRWEHGLIIYSHQSITFGVHYLVWIIFCLWSIV